MSEQDPDAPPLKHLAPLEQPERYTLTETKLGRRPKLDAETRELIAASVAAGGTFAEACAIADVGLSTGQAWLAKGRTQKKGEHREFLDALLKAKRKRIALNLANVQRAGQKDWRASAWFLERLDPKRFAPRVRFHVEQELTSALAKLEARFAKAQPDVWESILSALAADVGEAEAGSDPDLPDGEDI